MSTRISSAATALLLAACSQAATEAPAGKAHAGNLIECATGGAGSFARDCTVEQRQGEDGLVLVVRHADGGFRRFVPTADGTGVTPADGAEPATVSLRDGGIEVAVGGDRYRFPATIMGDDAR